MAVRFAKKVITMDELLAHGLDKYEIVKWYGNTDWEFIPNERNNMLKRTKIYRFDLLGAKDFNEEDSEFVWKLLKNPLNCMFNVAENPVIWMLPRIDRAEVAVEWVLKNVSEVLDVKKLDAKLVKDLQYLCSGSTTCEFSVDWYEEHSDAVDFLLADNFIVSRSFAEKNGICKSEQDVELQFCMTMMKNGNLKLWLCKPAFYYTLLGKKYLNWLSAV